MCEAPVKQVGVSMPKTLRICTSVRPPPAYWQAREKSYDGVTGNPHNPVGRSLTPA